MAERAGTRGEAATLADLANLQGVWVQVLLEVDGVSDPADPFTAPGMVTVIDGTRFCVRRPSGEVVLAGTFELDAGTCPKSITWIDAMGADAGRRLPASYRLERDRSHSLPQTKDRPGRWCSALSPGRQCAGSGASRWGVDDGWRS